MFVGTSFSSPVMPRTSAPQKVAEPVAQDQVSAGVALDKAPSFKDILALVGTTAERLEPTEPDIDGPYYRAGAPERSELFTETGDPAKRLKVMGSVLSTDGEKIPNAKLDFWLSDPNGEYDNESPEFKGRGWQSAQADGSYGLDTARPGNLSLIHI